MAKEPGVWHRVCLNTIVRKGVKLDSERLRILPMGSRVFVTKTEGRRVKISQPINGWCSLSSSNGDTILTPLEDVAEESGKQPRTMPEQQRHDEQKKIKLEEEKKTLTEKKKDAMSHEEVRLLKEKLERAQQKLTSQGENNAKATGLVKSLERQLANVCSQLGVANPEEVEAQIKAKDQQIGSMQEQINKLLKQLKEIKTISMPEKKKLDARNQSWGVGDAVILKDDWGIVVVRWIGEIDGEEFIGVELGSDIGNCDGCHVLKKDGEQISDKNGDPIMVRRFQTKPFSAAFVKIALVERKVTPMQMLQKLVKLSEQLAILARAKD